jgi:hypothetical protein
MGSMCLNRRKITVNVSKQTEESKVNKYETFINNKYYYDLQGSLWLNILDMLTLMELHETGKISR